MVDQAYLWSRMATLLGIWQVSAMVNLFLAFWENATHWFPECLNKLENLPGVNEAFSFPKTFSESVILDVLFILAILTGKNWNPKDF